MRAFSRTIGVYAARAHDFVRQTLDPYFIEMAYSATFKAEAVRELMKEAKTISQRAAEIGIHPT